MLPFSPLSVENRPILPRRDGARAVAAMASQAGKGQRPDQPGVGRWLREPALAGPRVDFQAALRSKNCSSSVDPFRAAVEALASIVVVTASKYPVPTSRWCFTAV